MIEQKVTFQRKCGSIFKDYLLQIFKLPYWRRCCAKFLIFSMRFFVIKSIPWYMFIPPVTDQWFPRSQWNSTPWIRLKQQNTIVKILDDHCHVIFIVINLPKLDRVKNLWTLAKKWSSWNKITSPVWQLFMKNYSLSNLLK